MREMFLQNLETDCPGLRQNTLENFGNTSQSEVNQPTDLK